MEALMNQNSYLIKCQTTRERNCQFKTIIQIVNINSFMGAGSTVQESKEAAAVNCVEYFKDFADRIV